MDEYFSASSTHLPYINHASNSAALLALYKLGCPFVSARQTLRKSGGSILSCQLDIQHPD